MKHLCASHYFWKVPQFFVNAQTLKTEGAKVVYEIFLNFLHCLSQTVFIYLHTQTIFECDLLTPATAQRKWTDWINATISQWIWFLKLFERVTKRFLPEVSLSWMNVTIKNLQNKTTLYCFLQFTIETCLLLSCWQLTVMKLKSQELSYHHRQLKQCPCQPMHFGEHICAPVLRAEVLVIFIVCDGSGAVRLSLQQQAEQLQAPNLLSIRLNRYLWCDFRVQKATISFIEKKGGGWLQATLVPTIIPLPFSLFSKQTNHMEQNNNHQG